MSDSRELCSIKTIRTLLVPASTFLVLMGNFKKEKAEMGSNRSGLNV